MTHYKIAIKHTGQVVYIIYSRMKVILLLLVGCVCTGSGTFTNAVTGMLSKTVSCDELKLASTSSFQPINPLISTVYISKPSSVFVNYQLTINKTSIFQTKLQIDNFDVGSIVRLGTQLYKTMTGYWMGYINNPGYYTFKILYTGSAYVPASLEWQAAKMDIMWFEHSTTDVLSDNIKCYPSPTTSNNFDNWGPVANIEVVVRLPKNGPMLGAYQFSTSSSTQVFTSLDINGFQQPSTSFVAHTTGKSYLDLHGIWAKQFNDGIHYFNVLYRSTSAFHFSDCQLKHRNNKNLYVMMLPSTCGVINVNPKTDFEITNSTWAETDVCYKLVIEKTHHVIVMYHFTSESEKYHVFNRLTKDSVPIKHTASIAGNTKYAGNSGLWQGALAAGNHTFCVEYSSNVDKAMLNKAIPWHTRSMTIVYC